jgi:hypothetical protein
MARPRVSKVANEMAAASTNEPNVRRAAGAGSDGRVRAKALRKLRHPTSGERQAGDGGVRVSREPASPVPIPDLMRAVDMRPRCRT